MFGSIVIVVMLLRKTMGSPIYKIPLYAFCYLEFFYKLITGVIKIYLKLVYTF